MAFAASDLLDGIGLLGFFVICVVLVVEYRFLPSRASGRERVDKLAASLLEPGEVVELTTTAKRSRWTPSADNGRWIFVTNRHLYLCRRNLSLWRSGQPWYEP